MTVVLGHRLGCEVWLALPCCCGSGAPAPELDAEQAAWALGARRQREAASVRETGLPRFAVAPGDAVGALPALACVHCGSTQLAIEKVAKRGVLDVMRVSIATRCRGCGRDMELYIQADYGPLRVGAEAIIPVPVEATRR